MGPGQGKLDQSESDLKVPRLNCMRLSISQEHSQESIRDESNEHLGLDEIPNIYSLSFDAKVPTVCWLTELAGLGKTIRSASYSTKLASHSSPSAHSSSTARIRGFLSPLCVVTLQKNISLMLERLESHVWPDSVDFTANEHCEDTQLNQIRLIFTRWPKIVSGSNGRPVRVLDAKMDNLSRKLQGHTDSVTSVAFSPHGNKIVSGFIDGSLGIWDPKTGEQWRELRRH